MASKKLPTNATSDMSAADYLRVVKDDTPIYLETHRAHYKPADKTAREDLTEMNRVTANYPQDEESLL